MGFSPKTQAHIAERIERTINRPVRHEMTAAERLDMITVQNGCCAACGQRIDDLDDEVIDHDHRHCPGAQGCKVCIRGIVHRKCNLALGHLDDDPHKAMRLAEYLARNEVALRGKDPLGFTRGEVREVLHRLIKSTEDSIRTGLTSRTKGKKEIVAARNQLKRLTP